MPALVSTNTPTKSGTLTVFDAEFPYRGITPQTKTEVFVRICRESVISCQTHENLAVIFRETASTHEKTFRTIFVFEGNKPPFVGPGNT
jgi:hypothetical protein